MAAEMKQELGWKLTNACIYLQCEVELMELHAQATATTGTQSLVIACRKAVQRGMLLHTEDCSCTCDNSLCIDLKEVCLWEADHTPICVLDIRLTGINLPIAL